MTPQMYAKGGQDRADGARVPAPDPTNLGVNAPLCLPYATSEGEQ